MASRSGDHCHCTIFCNLKLAIGKAAGRIIENLKGKSPSAVFCPVTNAIPDKVST